ncbi:MAG: MlaD family protein [Ignavibacteria bacterium]|jgi:phospholipid/cholesterol/gamma-HCH transport system substrate-binding protein
MMTDRKKEIRVGIVALLSLIVLIAGITIGKGLIVGVSQNTLSFTFPSSGGIEIGAPIFINGVKRGSVISTENINGGVAIAGSIDDISDLHPDAQAKISMLEITGGKKIDITPGIASGNLDISKPIAGTISADATELISLVGDLGADASVTVKRLDSVLAQANSLLSDGIVVKQLRNTIKNADELMTTLNALMGDNKENMRDLIKDLGALAKDAKSAVNNNEPKLRSILTKLDSLAGSGQRLMAKTDTALAGVTDLTVETKDMMKDIKTNGSFINKLLYDKTTSKSIDTTLQRVNDLLLKIHEHGLNANIRLGTRP